MNLRNLLAAAAAGAVLSLAGVANADATSATETASATIVAPTSVQGTQTLAFGTIAKPTSGANTVLVGADSTVTSPTLGESGNGYITQNGQAHPAIFHLTGTANHAVSATATLDFGSTDNLSLGIGGSTIPTTAAAAIVPTATSALTLNASGVLDLPVGGQIEITNSTPVKTYSGTLTVNVTFN